MNTQIGTIDQNLPQVTIEQMLEPDAKRGRLYQPEYIANLVDQANEALSNYLEIHKAPKPVIDLLQNLIMLERCGSGLKHKDLSASDAAYLAQEMPAILNNISLLGDEFPG
jgi:hypothetical protein